MGYRSDVKALVYPNTGTEEQVEAQYAMLKTLMNTTFAKIMEDEGAYLTFNDHAMRLEFAVEDVKWYPSYPDVQQFERFLEDVAELGYSYEFMRIGEEDEDVERKTGGKDPQYEISLHRTIEFN